MVDVPIQFFFFNVKFLSVYFLTRIWLKCHLNYSLELVAFFFCILYFIYSCFFSVCLWFFPLFFPYHDKAEILPEYWRSPSIHRYTFHTSLFLLFCLLSNTFQYVFDSRQIKFSKSLFYKYINNNTFLCVECETIIEHFLTVKIGFWSMT